MKFLSVFLLLCLCSLKIHAEKYPDSFAAILDILNICYEDRDKTGVAIGECMLKELKEVPNPFGYKVAVYAESFDKNNPSKMTITIYNKFGDEYTCHAMAHKKITYKECTAKKNPVPREVYIIPPH